MPPNGYRITEPVAGFATGDILNVTRRYRPRHCDSMELECIGDTPGSETVVVTDELTGFSERAILDETARLGDWHDYTHTVDTGGVRGAATATRITRATLSRVADPILA